jgi:hypothetical protein
MRDHQLLFAIDQKINDREHPSLYLQEGISLFVLAHFDSN